MRCLFQKTQRDWPAESRARMRNRHGEDARRHSTGERGSIRNGQESCPSTRDHSETDHEHGPAHATANYSAANAMGHSHSATSSPFTQGAADTSSQGTPRRVRSFSISMTDPVSRSTYSALPQSHATEFLSRLALPDSEAARLSRSTSSFSSDRSHGRDSSGGHWRTPSGGSADAAEQAPDVVYIALDGGTRFYALGRVIGRGTFTECREGLLVAGAESGNVAPEIQMRFTSTSEQPAERVAVKIYTRNGSTAVRTGLMSHEDVFEHELAIWQRLRHPHILPLHAALTDARRMMAVSSLAPHGTLLEHVMRHGPFRENRPEGRRVFSKLADAVDYLHRSAGVAHRDIKLENVLLGADLEPYLCDFGLAEDLAEAAPLQPVNDPQRHFLKGSVYYLAPEEVEYDAGAASRLGVSELRRRADVWALGVVLYAMVAGRLPFTDDLLPRLQQDIAAGRYPPLSAERYSPALLRLVARLLAVRVEERQPLHVILSEETWHREDAPK